MTLTDVVLRAGLAVSLAVGGTTHALLYVHGYRHLPTVGPAFLTQASVSFAVGLLILVGGPAWLRWIGAVVAGGALVAFLLSRTAGLFGFSERGWQPSPHAAISVGAELLTVALWAAYLFRERVGRSP